MVALNRSGNLASRQQKKKVEGPSSTHLNPFLKDFLSVLTYPSDKVLLTRGLVHVNWFTARQQLKEHHPVAVDITLDQQMTGHSILRGDISAERRKAIKLNTNSDYRVWHAALVIWHA
jgi:hypothetical protein